MNGTGEKFVNAFDSLKLLVTVLTWVGFYEIHSNRRYVRICHYVYRISVFFIIVLFNLQHMTFIYLVSSEMTVYHLFEFISKFNMNPVLDKCHGMQISQVDRSLT